VKLQSFEQTAACHTEAAYIAFSNGDACTAASHVRAAFHAANNNRSAYLKSVSQSLIQRHDTTWKKQAEPALYKALALVLTLPRKRNKQSIALSPSEGIHRFRKGIRSSK